MVLSLESYRDRGDRLPTTGRHILAQYDEESIIVYQAYRPAIGHFAAKHGYFGGEFFKLDRMSWIKTSFLWMTYETQKEWQQALKISTVRLQWDPDRLPNGDRLERRAIQLGLRGEILSRYAREWIIEIEDISDFVSKQSQNIRDDCLNLLVPQEFLYFPSLNNSHRLNLTQSM